jgi:hypothetical protein
VQLLDSIQIPQLELSMIDPSCVPARLVVIFLHELISTGSKAEATIISSMPEETGA